MSSKYQNVIRNNLLKYNTYPLDHEVFQISLLMENANTHLVSVFKDYLLYDDITEFIKEYYSSMKIAKHLKAILLYYESSSYLFPNYTALEEGKYIYKNIIKKQKLIDYLEDLEEKREIKQKKKAKKHVENNENPGEDENEEDEDDSENEEENVFDTHIYHNIIGETQNDSLIIKLFGAENFKNRDNNNSNNFIITKGFVEGEINEDNLMYSNAKNSCNDIFSEHENNIDGFDFEKNEMNKKFINNNNIIQYNKNITKGINNKNKENNESTQFFKDSTLQEISDSILSMANLANKIKENKSHSKNKLSKNMNSLSNTNINNNNSNNNYNNNKNNTKINSDKLLNNDNKKENKKIISNYNRHNYTYNNNTTNFSKYSNTISNSNTMQTKHKKNVYHNFYKTHIEKDKKDGTKIMNNNINNTNIVSSSLKISPNLLINSNIKTIIKNFVNNSRISSGTSNNQNLNEVNLHSNINEKCKNKSREKHKSNFKENTKLNLNLKGSLSNRNVHITTNTNSNNNYINANINNNNNINTNSYINGHKHMNTFYQQKSERNNSHININFNNINNNANNTSSTSNNHKGSISQTKYFNNYIVLQLNNTTMQNLYSLLDNKANKSKIKLFPKTKRNLDLKLDILSLSKPTTTLFNTSRQKTNHNLNSFNKVKNVKNIKNSNKGEKLKNLVFNNNINLGNSNIPLKMYNLGLRTPLNSKDYNKKFDEKKERLVYDKNINNKNYDENNIILDNNNNKIKTLYKNNINLFNMNNNKHYNNKKTKSQTRNVVDTNIIKNNFYTHNKTTNYSNNCNTNMNINSLLNDKNLISNLNNKSERTISDNLININRNLNKNNKSINAEKTEKKIIQDKINNHRKKLKSALIDDLKITKDLKYNLNNKTKTIFNKNQGFEILDNYNNFGNAIKTINAQMRNSFKNDSLINNNNNYSLNSVVRGQSFKQKINENYKKQQEFIKVRTSYSFLKHKDKNMNF